MKHIYTYVYTKRRERRMKFLKYKHTSGYTPTRAFCENVRGVWMHAHEHESLISVDGVAFTARSL